MINIGMQPAITTFKMNNNRIIHDDEIRINVELIRIDVDGLNRTFYNEYNQEQILKLINTKGKLIVGTVEEIGSNFYEYSTEKISLGDKIVCISSLNIPIHIDRIIKMDFESGDIYCKGQAITFQKSSIVKIEPNIDTKSISLVFDELIIAKDANEVAIAKKSESVCLISKNPINAYIFMKALKFNNPYIKKFYIIMDISLKKTYSILQKSGIFDETNEIIFLEINQPLESYKKLVNNIDNIDYVLLTDDISGGELLALLISKTRGNIFFPTVRNDYVNNTLNCDGISKTVNLFAHNSEGHPFCEFDYKLAEQAQEGINKYYRILQNKQDKYKNCTENKCLDGICNIDGFVFKSKILFNKVKQLVNIAKYDCNVIIEGDTGTGKEMAMDIIHLNSGRAKSPCIKINCAVIQESLAESEFFGYEKGSFTGALANGKDGYFSMADKGILFLDEIEELSMNMQSKLLRVIQEKSFYKVGGTELINVDVRVICASNKNLKNLVKLGKFREDLYYRLNIATVYMPPLKDRVEDIECLTKFFWEKYNNKYELSTTFPDNILNILYKYDWPGNVRELENIIHRLVIANEDETTCDEILTSLTDKDEISRKIYDLNTKLKEEKVDFTSLVKDIEKQIIECALNKCGTTRKAAEYLNMSHTTLIRKKNNYGLDDKRNITV